jgi:hypothetical protein
MFDVQVEGFLGVSFKQLKALVNEVFDILFLFGSHAAHSGPVAECIMQQLLNKCSLWFFLIFLGKFLQVSLAPRSLHLVALNGVHLEDPHSAIEMSFIFNDLRE